MKESTTVAIVLSAFFLTIAICTVSDNWEKVEIARAEAQSCQKAKQ